MRDVKGQIVGIKGQCGTHIDKNTNKYKISNAFPIFPGTPFLHIQQIQ
jgi:hypothetical protein